MSLFRNLLRLGGILAVGLVAARASTAGQGSEADEVYNTLMKFKGTSLTSFEKQQVRKAVDDPDVLRELKKLVVSEVTNGPLERLKRDIADKKNGMSVEDILARGASGDGTAFGSMSPSSRKAHEIFAMVFGYPSGSS